MPGPAVELPLDHEIHGQIGISSCDRVLAALADRQHGRVARWQLDAFMSRGAIEHRLLTGRLRRVRRGVYAVGYVSDTREARWMTAVLAAGPGSVLSHRSAAAMWSLRRTNPAWGEVTVVQRTRCGGVRVHHALLPPDEITTRNGIPVTTVPRTILDLAAVLGVGTEEVVPFAEADDRGLVAEG
jgi:predicted transcriptional regulator of viral defense system